MLHYILINSAAIWRRIFSMPNQNRLSLFHNLERTHRLLILPITCRITMNSGHCGQIRITNFGKTPRKPAVLISRLQSINKQDLLRTILNLMASLSATITMAYFAMMPFAWAQILALIMCGSVPIHGMWNSPTVCLISLPHKAWIRTILNILWMANHLALAVRLV